MEPIVKFKRSVHGAPDDYGISFMKELNRAVGGKRNWMTGSWSHGEANTKDNGLRIRRCEDGPEFYLNVANTIAAYGSLIVSLTSLWFSIPKREKELKGKRTIVLRQPGLCVDLECENYKKNKSRVEKIIKAMR